MKQELVLDSVPGGFSMDEDALRAVLRQRPNRKVLFTRFHLGVYNMVNPDRMRAAHQRKEERIERRIDRKKSRGKEFTEKELKEMRADTLGWRDWMRNTVGEAPVIFDSTLAEKSAEQLSILLSKNGYFTNDVRYEARYSSNKKKVKKLQFHISARPAYRIDSIRYTIRDEGIARREDFIRATSELREGDRFSVDAMDDERQRIADYLNNRGYYSFSKEFITYRADSSIGDHKVDVELVLRRTQRTVQGADSIIYRDHKRYFIGDIFIHADYDPSDREYEPTDTLMINGVYLLYRNELEMKPELLAYLLEFKKGDLYQRERVDLTYRRYVELPIIRSCNISFSVDESSEVDVLNCTILLAQMKRQSMSAETGVTHRDGLFGLSGSLNFRNRNLFRRGETAQLRVSGAIEAQQPLTLTENEELTGAEIADNIRFNTFEIGPEVTLFFPRFFPLGFSKFRRSNAPRTTLSAAFNYQDRPDYTRQLYQFRYGVNFVENADRGSRIFWDIWDLSTIKIEKSTAFEAFLDALNDDFLRNSYQNHLISSGRVSWLLNKQRSRSQRRYFYNQVTLEGAGNLPRLGFDVFNGNPDEDNSYDIAGIRFAQYVKVENDFRLYRRIDERNSGAFRLQGGIGVPGTNLPVLPFEKSFFGGGSNGIRAWEPRTLGPGSYRDTTALVTFNNIGELILQASAEYRFKLTETVEGALFLDVGNIWLVEEEPNRPGSGFEFETFLSELAWGGGLGIRLDFDFFLMRFDLGMQLKDPAKVPGERWLWEPKDEYASFAEEVRPTVEYNFFPEVNFNLGIGYPF
jgi:outer membrane protein assembly factor BamA